MIHSVSANDPRFKKVEFKNGFNVILAIRTKESTKKDSRNGLGKTTLIDIIHFCLGASAVKGKGLLRKPLEGWSFSIDIDLLGKRYTVERSTGKPGQVIIYGDVSNLPIQPKYDTKTKEYFYKNSDWTMLLGQLMFGIEHSVEQQKYMPKFRSLVPYFARRGRDAFSTPFEHYRKQREWEKQVYNTFLLDLGWEYAQKWQILKDEEAILKKLKNAAKSGLVSSLIGSRGELEAAKTRLERMIAKEQEQLENFKVHPKYREIEEEANDLTFKIHELANDNVIDNNMVKYYQSSYMDERPAKPKDVVKMYKEAGIYLPELVVRRIDDVQEFHRQIISNRKNFVQSEIARLNENIIEREKEIFLYSEKRSSLLSILKSHGALEEYNKIQKQHTKRVSELEDLKIKIDNLKKFQEGKSSLVISLEKLFLEARADYDERWLIREHAVTLFNSNSEELYSVPGRLIIDVIQTGYKFGVEIERSTSQGIEQMKVFCYDLLLSRLWARKNLGPGFLIHDSTIFDGVDERQVALALQLVARESKEEKFQYICCLNSDMIPWNEFNDEFNLNDYVRLELTDATDDGGLLGIRF